MWKSFFNFIWEWVVGKDVRLGTAIRHHKLRLTMFVVLILSLGLNYFTVKRLTFYYNAYEYSVVKNNEKKERILQLEAENKKLIDRLISR